MSFILRPERDAELLAAIRKQCPDDRKGELEMYLFNHSPSAAKPVEAGEWAGLCLADGTILVDPDCRSPLETYLHELAHASVGVARGHDPAFQRCAEALYQRFGIKRSRLGKLYDVHEAAPAKQMLGEIGSRTWDGYRLSQAPVDPTAIAEAANREDARLAWEEHKSHVFGQVVLPLLFLGLPAALILLFFFLQSHFHLPALLREYPLRTLGVVSFLAALAIALWPRDH